MAMTTHEMVYQIFVVYIFLKALFFAPLLWFAFCLRMKERREALAVSANEGTKSPALSPEPEALYSGNLIEQAG